MIKRLKHIFKQSQMKFMCCVDTNFIEGTVLKIIEKESWKIEIKDDSRLKLLNECDCLIFVNDINIYEIKSKLLKDFNIPFDRLDEIYNSAMSYFVNIKRMSSGAQPEEAVCSTVYSPIRNFNIVFFFEFRN